MVASRSPKMKRIDELLPVSGNESAFFTVATIVGTVVVEATFAAVGVTVVAGATGDPVSAFEAGESPTPFTALMVTE